MSDHLDKPKVFHSSFRTQGHHFASCDGCSYARHGSLSHMTSEARHHVEANLTHRVTVTRHQAKTTYARIFNPETGRWEAIAE